MTTGQVADAFGVNFRTVIRWIKKGYLTAHRLPGRGDHRVSVEEFERFKQANLSESATAREAPVTKRVRVLIVDDDRAAASAIARCLHLDGVDTCIAESAFRAGALLQDFKPHVMTLDLLMDEMDGLDILKAMPDLSKSHPPAIIVISGDSDQRIQQAMSLGAHAFLKKPYATKDLVATIAALAQSKIKSKAKAA